MEKLKVLDLFSGIGGFSLGLERTGGFETVAFCEIEDYPRKVLAKHWPDVLCHKDVRKLDGKQYIGADLICGGYPCQPFSVAGERKGEEDDRHLWPEVRRLVAEIHPTWCLFENVAGHISLGLDEVLSDLESEGYTSQALLIPACAVDAPHRRDRVWIIAHNDSIKRSADEGEPNTGADRRNDSWGVCQDVAHTDSPLGEGNERPKRGAQERTNDFEPSRWATEPDICRVANGVPKRVDRLKGLGNAVVPQIPEMIGYGILQSYEK